MFTIVKKETPKHFGRETQGVFIRSSKGGAVSISTEAGAHLASSHVQVLKNDSRWRIMRCEPSAPDARRLAAKKIGSANFGCVTLARKMPTGQRVYCERIPGGIEFVLPVDGE